MPLYIRCVLANKYTLVGYAFLAIGVVLMLLKIIYGWPTIGSVALTGTGLGLLLYSRFGLITMRVYRTLMDEYRRSRGVAHGVGRMSHHHQVGVDLVVADIDKQLEMARQEPP